MTRPMGVMVVKMNTTMISASKKHWSAANSYRLMFSTDTNFMRFCTGAGHTTVNEAQNVPMICTPDTTAGEMSSIGGGTKVPYRGCWPTVLKQHTPGQRRLPASTSRGAA